MILATCQCQHILCIHYWVEPSLLLSSFLFVSQKIKCAFFSRHFPFPFFKLMIKDCYFLFVSQNLKHNAPSAGIWERMWVPNCPFQAICDQKCDNHSVVFYHFFSVQGQVEKWPFFLFLWSHLLPRSDLWRWLVWRSSAQANNICRGEIRTAFALDPITNHTFEARLNPIKNEWHQVHTIEILCGFAPAIDLSPVLLWTRMNGRRTRRFSE